MARASQEPLIREIHDAGLRCVLAVSGGGSGAISALLSVGGASRSVLAAVVPYAEAALVEWLGGPPESFCSSHTARSMAMAAFEKARQYDPAGKVCGVACTASLASDRPKHGPHRAHLAYQTATTTATLCLQLEKGRRSRAEEEDLVADMLLNMMAEACGVSTRLDVPLGDSEVPHREQVVAPPGQQDLVAGRAQMVAAAGARESEKPLAVLPGAFNPLHSGHRHMAIVAGRLLGHEVAFELSVANVDKPPLDFIEIERRIGQFTPDEVVWLTRAPLFVDKAELFPGATFIVGADTIERIGEARYYGGQPAALERAIARIAASGCRFLVFGRTIEGRFCALGDLALPPVLAAICREVPENVFREDISSTELRRGRLPE